MQRRCSKGCLEETRRQEGGRGQSGDRHLIPESDKRGCDRNKGRQCGSGSAEVPLCPRPHPPPLRLIESCGHNSGPLASFPTTSILAAGVRCDCRTLGLETLNSAIELGGTFLGASIEAFIRLSIEGYSYVLYMFLWRPINRQF